MKQSLMDPRKPILVLDTVMNLYPMAVTANVPDEFKNCFRVHIHVQSYLERKTTTICDTLEAQLTVSGAYGLDTLLPNDGFKHKKAFASLSSEIGSEGPLPKSTFSDPFRPHYVCTVVRTEEGILGYDNLIASLDTLTRGFKIPEAVDAETKSNNLPEEEHAAQDPEDSFGIDPLTKDMNICQFITHLLGKFSGDRSKVREFLRTLGGSRGQANFMMNAFLEKSYDKTLPPESQSELITKLADLSSRWYRAGVIDREFTPEQLIADEKLRDTMLKSIVTIKYTEGHGAHYWHNKWAVEARGVVLFINPVTDDVKVLSFKLPRGPEVLTGMVQKNGLETQDLVHGRTKILSVESQDTCERLCNTKDLQMHLSFKADGSLCVINCYTGDALQIMFPVVDLFGSEYSRLWAEQSMKLTNGKRLILPATQGTVMEEGFMAPYMVTSMLSGCWIIIREELLESKMTYLDAWRTYGESFIQKILQFTFSDDLTEVHTLSFEAICKDRCGLFGDRPHTELACSYDRDRFVFLGMSIADKRFYIPHSVYGSKFNIPFEEPLWWNVSHASQVDVIMDVLGKMILGEVTKREFLALFLPMNKDFDINNDEHILRAVIDFEGWVGMKFPTFPVTDGDHLEVSRALDTPYTVYCKLKSEAYYRAHKFHKSNLAYLAKLAKTAGHIFPLAQKVTSICQDGAINSRFTKIGNSVLDQLDFSKPELMAMLRASFQKTMTDYEKAMADFQARTNAGEKDLKPPKTPKDPLNGFEKRPRDVQCKIALNMDNFEFGIFERIYQDTFPEIDPNVPELKHILRTLTMELAPWKKGYADRIKDLDAESPVLHDLILACIGTTVH